MYNSEFGATLLFWNVKWLWLQLAEIFERIQIIVASLWLKTICFYDHGNGILYSATCSQI